MEQEPELMKHAGPIHSLNTFQLIVTVRYDYIERTRKIQGGVRGALGEGPRGRQSAAQEPKGTKEMGMPYSERALGEGTEWWKRWACHFLAEPWAAGRGDGMAELQPRKPLQRPHDIGYR